MKMASHLCTEPNPQPWEVLTHQKETLGMSGNSQEEAGVEDSQARMPEARGWDANSDRPGLEFTRRNWDFTPSTRGRDRRILSKIAT